MSLPSYFLADLPPEATVTSLMITEACHTLKRNRERYLAECTTESMIHVISSLAKDWLDPEFSFRQTLLQSGPASSGFSEATLAAGLDSFFAQLTARNLENLILQDFGHIDRLDKFSSNDQEQTRRQAALARAPELIFHIAAGNVPNPTLSSMIFGLLLRSAQFIKCASGTSLIPRAFAHSLYQVEPKLSACLEIAEWKGGGSKDLEATLFAEADCVTATGSDETLRQIRQQVPAHVRFAGYGHQLSFGYIAHEVLTGAHADQTAERAARDVAAWNQLGCLSPHVFYVESGGRNAPERFAEMLALALAAHEKKEPRGPLAAAEAAAIAHRRAFYEIRAANSPDTKMWQSENSTAWTVIFEADPRFQVSCLNRFIYVKGIATPEEALHGAGDFIGKISTVGLAATGTKAKTLAERLARWGAKRICPLGQMQNPPLTWRHDGRPALGDLITWSDWEQSQF